MRLGYLVPTLFFGAFAALGFFLAHRKAKKVKFFQQEELEVGQVTQAAVCKVHGVVATPQPIIAPFSGKPCAWYAVLVQEYVQAGRYSRWQTVHHAASGSVFQLKDRKGPGTIEIDPRGADVKLATEGGSEDRQLLANYLQSIGQSRLLGFGNLRANETTLEAGEKIMALGTIVQTPGGYRMQAGKSPYVISDTDSGQIAYQENNSMYVMRFWGGLCALAALYFAWHLVRH